jgi:hypothetical protein
MRAGIVVGQCDKARLLLPACLAQSRGHRTQSVARLGRRTRTSHCFDSVGLLLLVVVMVSWEVMLSKGQQ